MNSSLIALYTEILSQQMGGGGGPLRPRVYEIEKLLIPDIRLLSSTVLNKLEVLSESFINRDIGSIFEEFGGNTPVEIGLNKIMDDRRELDKIIMGDILCLSEEEQLEVYRAVVDLVRTRIEKARSVGQQKKTKEGIDIEMLIRNVLTQMGDETLGNYYHESILTKPCYEKPMPEMEGDAKVIKDLFKWHLAAGKNTVECRSEIEAEYLKCFAGAGLEIVMVPHDEKHIKKILPELQELRRRTDSVIEDDIKSILSLKTQKTVLHLLWQRIMNPSSIPSIQGEEKMGEGNGDDIEA